MKLIFKIFCLLLIILFVFTSCNDDKNNVLDYKEVYFSSCGFINVPKEWEIMHNNNLYYVLDSKNAPVLIQTFSECEYYPSYKEGVFEKNDYHGYQCLNYKNSEVLSNGATFGVVECKKDGVNCELLFLRISNYINDLTFIVYDESIDIDDLKKIAETYAPV